MEIKPSFEAIKNAKAKAKSKAKQLVDKYFEYAEAFTINQQNDNAIECAIIEVDKILDVDCRSMNEHDFDEHIEFHQQVKQELINLKQQEQ
jgi:hypothetical protein